MNLTTIWNGDRATTHEVATVIWAAKPIPNLPAGLTDHAILEAAAAEGLTRFLIGIFPKLFADQPDLIQSASLRGANRRSGSCGL